MLTYTRSQILAASKGSVIPAVKVIVTKLFDRKSGQSPDKFSPVPNAMRVWSMQSGKCLVDGIGGRAEEVAIKFDGYDEMGALVGKTILIESTDKGKGFHGVTADDNVYKGTTTRQIKVTKAAKIGPAYDEQGGDPNAYQQAMAQPAQEQVPQPQHTPAQPAPLQGRDVARAVNMAILHQQRAPNSQPAGSIGAAKLHLNRLANLYILCVNAAKYITHECGNELEAGGEYRPEDATSLFIQATRDGLTASMPTGKLEADAEPSEDLPLGASPAQPQPKQGVWNPETDAQSDCPY